MKITFTVPGDPQSKMRPRFSHQGKFIKTYTPEKTVQYESLVKLAYCHGEESIPYKLQGAIRAEVKAFFPIPKSVSKKKHAEMVENKILPITTPKDIDNVCKSILDALNGIAYDDDRQIIELHGYKLYSENPRAEVVLEELIDSFPTYMNEPMPFYWNPAEEGEES